jgi:hypothetical protein
VETEERPSKEGCIQGSYIRVLEDVEVVVPVHELVAKGREIHQKGCQSNQRGKIVITVPGFLHYLPLT